MENWVSKLIMLLGFPHKNRGNGGGNCGYGWGHEMDSWPKKNVQKVDFGGFQAINYECPKSADQIIW